MYQFLFSIPLARTACAVLALAFAVPASAHTLYVLTTTNGLATVDDATPGSPATVLPVGGLAPGDALVAIDVRPQNNRLYGLGYNASTSSVQLYLVENRAGSANATAIGPAGAFVDAGGAALPITGTAFDIDFNPTVDRLRVITGSGQSFRMNPNTGALVDGDLGMAAGSVAGVNPDGSANGAGTTFDATAYTNNRANVAATTLYAIDAASDRLFIVNPPNAGTLTSAKPLMLAGSPLDINAESGFDIPAGIDVGTSNTAASGLAYGAFTVAGASGLYRVELSTADATFVGALGGLNVRDIAVATLPSSAQSLDASGTSLRRFLVQSPAATINVAITGVTAGERLVGFDVRPATGQWIALGVNVGANTGSLYRIDPQTGAASMIGATPGTIAFVDGSGMTVDLPDGTYGVSFNPSVDRVRVVASNGVNFRANPITGGPADGDLGGMAGSVAGINPDGTLTISGLAAGIHGAAYTNNVAGTTVTTLYTLDAVGDRLFIQNPPNGGAQTSPLAVTVDAVPVDFTTTTGFDIPPGPAAAANNLPVTGFGYAALTVGGSTRLFRIALDTGAAQDFGPIGNGTVASAGLTIGDVYDDVIFADGFD
jgi:hypothetical protein